MKRIKGFVVGYDVKRGKIVWTVKAKDPTSEHNGHKFEVASVYLGTMLSKPGVDVTFRVQDVESGQEKVLRAVDVNVGSKDPVENQITERIPDALIFALTGEMIDDRQVLNVWYSECETAEEAKETHLGFGAEEEIYIGLIKITPELVLEHGGVIQKDEAVAGLATLRQMVNLNPIRDVLRAIIVEAFKLGKESAVSK